MRKIRIGAFESNSSSSHTLILHRNMPKKNRMGDLRADKYGELHLEGRQFGWEEERYNDEKTKALYLLYQAGTDSEWLIDIIKELSGAHTVVIDGDENDYNGVDHQSQGIASDILADPETVRDFIINPNYYLYTGNDNERPAYGFYDAPGTRYGLRISVFIQESSISKTKLGSVDVEGAATKGRLMQAIDSIVNKSGDQYFIHAFALHVGRLLLQSSTYNSVKRSWVRAYRTAEVEIEPHESYKK